MINNDFSERKHNLKVPRIVPIEKSFHEQRGKPTLIRDVGGFSTDGRIVPSNNDGGKPFDGGGN
jgi:hypothetical protein